MEVTPPRSQGTDHSCTWLRIRQLPGQVPGGRATSLAVPKGLLCRLAAAQGCQSLCTTLSLSQELAHSTAQPAAAALWGLAEGDAAACTLPDICWVLELSGECSAELSQAVPSSALLQGCSCGLAGLRLQKAFQGEESS